MKEIKIKYINKYKYKYHIIIYDCYGNKVFGGFTDETGTLILDVSYYGVYKILILRNKNIKVITNFYVDENQYNFFYFRDVSIKRCLHLVTFKITDELQTITMEAETHTVEIANEKAVTKEITLTDANYNGLPIEDGSITLTSE